MKNPQITTEFYLSLLEFLLSGKQLVISVGNDFGLTSIQTITLMLIDEHHPRAMGTLGQLFHCDASNVTGIIDGLEQKQLVERKNDPKDRRVKVVCLTAAGKRMQRQIIERMTADNDLLFAPLSDTEMHQFTHIVEKLAAAKRLT